ncbi:hypothetical protein [Moraxella ovis]|uniref:hypothetical protein n=1 Tax=Moraxella ovis TaxID=29433 RepID=UPI0021ABEC32|nr:hypothetical protein [Moraxella ovis]
MGDGVNQGTGATASGENAIAVGNDAAANTRNSVSIDNSAGQNFSNQGSAYYGTGRIVSGGQVATTPTESIATFNNIAIGTKAGNKSSGRNNVVMGNNAGTQHFGENSVIIGHSANNSSGETTVDGTKMGGDTQARACHVIAIGEVAKTESIKYNVEDRGSLYRTAESAIALGMNSIANGYRSITQGVDAKAERDHSIAIGSMLWYLPHHHTTSPWIWQQFIVYTCKHFAIMLHKNNNTSGIGWMNYSKI